MHDPLEQLLVQIAVILLAARIVGGFMRFIGQPRVVGEMLAGIILGPSVLGLLDHGAWQAMLFPVHAGSDPYPFLNILSQIGVVLFMFLVGLELDMKLLRNQGKALVVTGSASVAGPLICGIILGLVLFHGFHGAADNKLAFALFIGTAMCITAFPVLARMINERNLQRTRLGIFSLACGAFNDVVGWCLLALVIAISAADHRTGSDVQHPVLSALMTVIWTAVFGAFMLLIMPKLLRRMQGLYERRGYLSQDTLAVILLLLLVTSCITAWIGIQAIFGAFLLGMAMPAESRFVRHLTEKLEDFILLFLLPIFFAYTGLRTRIGLLDNAHLWKVCLVVVVVATGSKIVFSTLAARTTGFSWRHSGVLGSLLNARGLIELIVLNIGLNMHVLSPQMFAIMVIMALATTFLTTPLLFLVYSPGRQRHDAAAEAPPESIGEARVLAAVSSPQTASGLVRAAALLTDTESGRLILLHLDNPEQHEQRQKSFHTPSDPLDLALKQAALLEVPANAIGFVSTDFAADITLTARRYDSRWIVLGGHHGMFAASTVGRLAEEIIRDSGRSVAIFVDKGMRSVQRILIPYLGESHEVGALVAAEMIARKGDIQVTILHVVKPGGRSSDAGAVSLQGLVDRYFSGPVAGSQVRFQVFESAEPAQVVIEQSKHYELIILGISPQWQLRQKILGRSQTSVAEGSLCSVLAVHASVTAGSVNPDSVTPSALDGPAQTNIPQPV